MANGMRCVSAMLIRVFKKKSNLPTLTEAEIALEPCSVANRQKEKLYYLSIGGNEAKDLLSVWLLTFVTILKSPILLVLLFIMSGMPAHISVELLKLTSKFLE